MASPLNQPAAKTANINPNNNTASALIRRPPSRLIFGLVGLVIVAACAWGALTQDLKPEPLQRFGVWESGWWRYPVETGAYRRMAVIDGDVLGVEAAPDGHKLWAVGSGGLILYSADSGRHWVQQKYPVDRPKKASEIFPLSKQHRSAGMAPAAKELLVASAGIGAFAHVKSPGADQRDTMVPAAAMKKGRLDQGQWRRRTMAADGNNKSPLPTKDQSKRPTKGKPKPSPKQELQPDPFRPAILYDVQFLADGTRGWAVGESGTILATGDGGKTWAPQTSNTSNSLYSVQFLADGTRGWAVGQGGTILTTGNGGKTWAPQTSATSNDLYSVQFLADGTRGWALGESGTILATDDGGKSWVSQAMSRDAYGKALEAYFSDGRQWKIDVASGRLMVRTNEKADWKTDDTVPARYPAPWFFIGLFVASGFLARAARPAPAPVLAERSVSDEYASDRPLKPGDPDPLEFGEVAAGLSRFIRNQNTEPPLTIAVTGPWGTGKSSLMNLLCGDLSDNGFRPVWFNAWHHQKEEHLLAALLETVRAHAVPPWWIPAGWIFRFNLFCIRLKQRPQTAIILLALLLFPLGVFIAVPDTLWGAVANAVTNLFGGTEKAAKNDITTVGILGGSSIASFFAFVFTLYANTRSRLGSFGIKPASLLSSLQGRASGRELRAQLGFRHRFAAEFADVTQALKPLAVVIVIDDLDRCRPDNVVEVLEAVNFLITSGDCYVILGMDCQWAERCIGEAYKDIADHPTDEELKDVNAGQNEPSDGEAAKQRRRTEFARRYLQKLVNIEVPVPRVAAEDAAKITVPRRQQVLASEDKPRWLDPKMWRLGQSVLIFALWLVLSGGLFGIGHFMGDKVAESLTPQESAGNTKPVGTLVDDTRTGGATGSGGVTKEGRLFGIKAVPRSYWWIGVPVTLLLALMLLVGYEQFRRRRSAVVQDSPEFAYALQLWTPLVFSRDGTPRAIKGAYNYLLTTRQ